MQLSLFAIYASSSRFLTYLGQRWALYTSLLFVIAGTILATETYAVMNQAAATAEPKAASVQGVKVDNSTRSNEVLASHDTQTPVAVTTSPAPVCQVGVNAHPSAVQLSMGSPGVTSNLIPSQYYTVYGNTLHEIQKQIFNCSPVRHNGQTYAASTNYTLNWTYSYSLKNNICTITDAAVGISVVQILPAWESSSSASGPITSSWYTFSANLKLHEDGHTDIALRYAQEIYNRLKTLPPVDCASLTHTANAAANESVAALRNANTAYDSMTGHGVTQGALLAR